LEDGSEFSLDAWVTTWSCELRLSALDSLRKRRCATTSAWICYAKERPRTLHFLACCPRQIIRRASRIFARIRSFWGMSVQLAILLPLKSINGLLRLALPAEGIADGWMAARRLSLTGFTKDIAISSIASKRVFSSEWAPFSLPILH